MHFHRLGFAAIPIGIAAAGILFLSGTASAAESDVPTATGVTVLASDTDTELALADTPTATDTTQLQTDGQEPDGIVQSDSQNRSGWQTINGVRYYYDPETGEALTGVQEIDGTYYLFDYTGAQKTGWRTVNGIRHYYDPKTGKISTGWISSGGYRYYANANTGKQTGEITVQNIHYLLDETYGYQHLGFCTFSDKTVSYYKPDGSIVSGWLETDGKSYYFDSSYRMKTGWQTISGKKYCFADNGAMYTGLVKIGTSTYYFAGNGVMRMGWQTIYGNKYYFSADGRMQTGWQTINSSKYYFSTDGKMRTGWQTISGKRYYFQSNGVMLTSTTKDGYRIGADGVAVKIVYPKADAILEQIGRSLKSAFDWAAALPYYGHTADMPQTADPGIRWYADYGFDNRKGNCYVMAAVFCEMARELGYDAKQISGQVPLASGGLGAHSWVEIEINGTTYVFDPDFTNETGRNGYQIIYGQSGTWRYVKGSVMSD